MCSGVPRHVPQIFFETAALFGRLAKPPFLDTIKGKSQLPFYVIRARTCSYIFTVAFTIKKRK